MAQTALVSVCNDSGTVVYAIPQPSTYVGTTATIVDSARNVNGYVVGSVVRADVAKIEMTWRYIDAKTWADILSQFAGKNRFYRKIKFYNQDKANAVSPNTPYDTRTMYVSDRTSGGVHLLDDAGNVKGWIDARLSLIEK